MASGGPDDVMCYETEDEKSPRGNDTGENEWQKVNRRKRKRFNTGTAELSNFQSLSGDDKLALVLEKIVNIEEKMPNFKELQSTVETVRVKTERAESSIKDHDRHITMLSYKSVDLEARSRRKNLIFRGLYECYKEDCASVLKQFF